MDNKEIRKNILRFLYDRYQIDPHQGIAKNEICEQLGFDKNIVDGNVKYLEQKKLIDVSWFIGGTFLAKINSNGIDEIEEEIGGQGIQNDRR